MRATAITGTTTATAILPPAERPEDVEGEGLAVAAAAPLDLLADDLVVVTLVTATGVVVGLDDVDVKVIVFGCGVPSLVGDVSTILVTWKSEVDDGVGAAAAAWLVEDVVGATTNEGACEVVDIEVEVVSTTTALLDVAGAGVDAGAGAVARVVDRTT